MEKEEQKPKCPICDLSLYERYEGWVCKNHKCKMYHKLEIGWVLMTRDSKWSNNRARVNIFYSQRQRLRLAKQFEELKRQVLIRDDYTCLKCKYNLADDFYHTIGLEVHHIIKASEEMALYLDMNNLITLCKDCHKKIHEEDKYKFGK